MEILVSVQSRNFSLRVIFLAGVKVSSSNGSISETRSYSTNCLFSTFVRGPHCHSVPGKYPTFSHTHHHSPIMLCQLRFLYLILPKQRPLEPSASTLPLAKFSPSVLATSSFSARLTSYCEAACSLQPWLKNLWACLPCCLLGAAKLFISTNGGSAELSRLFYTCDMFF